MLDNELKEFLDLRLKVFSGEIKEHINDVNDKARNDFNSKFKAQEDRLDEIDTKAENATIEIRFAKRIVYGIAGFFIVIGLPTLGNMIKSWLNNV